MEHCKLQLGCLIVVLYLVFIYWRGQRRFRVRKGLTLYGVLLLSGVVSLILDGVTAYTVNHLDTVPPLLNRILHGAFLVSIDTVIFVLFLYLLLATGDFPAARRTRIIPFLPFAANILVVILFLPSLEYRSGEISNYSMGISAYTCFIMAGLYTLLTIAVFLRRWNHLQKHRRIVVLSSLLTLLAVTGYQMLVPDSLVSSIATTMMLLGAYLNQEDPAMQELSRYHEEMVMGFATLIENRDDSTGGHVKRTAKYVELLADALLRRGYHQEVLTNDYRKNLLMAAPMHDIGKIAVPDAILQKPGRLTEEEFEQMKQHTVKGGEIIAQTFSRVNNEQYLELAGQIARHHHEKWNGKGYPDGLKGEEIPLCARIMAIADVFDAVSEHRCYRPALPLDECFAIIEKGRGQDFDPLLTDVFLDIREQVEAVYQKT